MPLPEDMRACMRKVKKEHPKGRTKENGKSEQAAHKQHVAMCLQASGQAREQEEQPIPSFAEFLNEQDEMQRLRDEMTALYKQLERTPPTLGMGKEPNPRHRRIRAAIRAQKEKMDTLKSRMGARADIETGRQTMRDVPPPAERPRQRTKLSREDVEAAIRMAVEELTGGSTAEEARVSGEMISSWIERNVGEYIDRRRIDKELSENPNLRDLEKFRKVGRTAGMTDIERELRYLRSLAKQR